jgi:hypothetical protein
LYCSCFGAVGCFGVVFAFDLDADLGADLGADLDVDLGADLGGVLGGVFFFVVATLLTPFSY